MTGLGITKVNNDNNNSILLFGFVFDQRSSMDLDVDFSDGEPSRPLVSMPPRCKDW